MYWGSSPLSYAFTQTVNSWLDTEVLITPNAPGIWYFAATAFNSEGNESAFSNEDSRLLTWWLPPSPPQAFQATWTEYIPPPPPQEPEALYHLPRRSFSGSEYVVAESFDVDPTNFEIEAVVVAEPSLAGDARIISRAKSSGVQDHDFMLGLRSTQQYVAGFRLRVNNSTRHLSGRTPIPRGVDVKIKATYDGQRMRIYVNDVLDGELSVTGSITFRSGYQTWVGANPTDRFAPWKGQIEVTVK